jgi:hypothetical protein
MASVQQAGNYRIYLESPRGNRKLVGSGDSYWWGPGGSPDGIPANTPDTWNFLPLSGDAGGPGYKIVVTLTPGAVGSLDASDCNMMLPVQVGGNMQNLGNSAHTQGIGNDNFTATLAMQRKA